MANKTTAKTTPATFTSATTKNNKPVAPVAKVSSTYKPSQEEIAARAFEIYQREGGSDQDNWLRAERELLARSRR